LTGKALKELQSRYASLTVTDNGLGIGFAHDAGLGAALGSPLIDRQAVVAISGLLSTWGHHAGRDDDFGPAELGSPMSALGHHAERDDDYALDELASEIVLMRERNDSATFGASVLGAHEVMGRGSGHDEKRLDESWLANRPRLRHVLRRSCWRQVCSAPTRPVRLAGIGGPETRTPPIPLCGR
jgi:hypothetical protein